MARIVHPAQIESALSSIWDSLQNTNKMRACLFNLIIYGKKSEQIDDLTDIAQKVIEKFPSRILLVILDEKDSAPPLTTAVSVMTADEGEQEIACDMIKILVGKKDHARIPFLILPHILPDLPVYLLYGDDPFLDNPISETLEHFAHRIIFDSASTSHLPTFAQAVLAHQKKTQVEVADLNWARISGWRQLFASVFKSQDDLNSLKEATTLHIYDHRGQSASMSSLPIQSIYFQGWLACQLEWHLQKVTKEGEILSFSYETAERPVHISLHPSKMEGVRAGRILSIQIETAQKLRYAFKRNLHCPHHVTIEKSSTTYCSLPTYYVLDKDVSGHSLVKEIYQRGTSEHYLKLLTLLSTIKNESLY